MNRVAASTSIKRHLQFALILAALFVSGMVPRGYMIAPSADHGFAVTLCPSTNPLARALQAASSQEHHSTGSAHGSHDSSHHQASNESRPDHGAHGNGTSASQSGADCAFAGLASLGLPIGEAGWTFSTNIAETRTLSALPELAITLQRRLRPPLRAPPTAV